MKSSKDRFVVHAVMLHEERARGIAATIPSLSVESQAGWNGVLLNRYEIAGTIDGADLQLFTSVVAGFRDSLSILEVNRVIYEGAA
jgi:hypothetical protein